MRKINKLLALSFVVLYCTNLWAIDEVLTFPGSDTNYCSRGAIYLSQDQSYKFKIPDLGKKVFIKERVINEGITYHVEFANIEVGFFYIVSTKIRADLPKDPEFIINRISKRYENSKTRWPNKFSDKFGKGEYGRFYQFKILNAITTGSERVPYPIATGIAGGKEITSVAVHQYFVANGYMYEFAVLTSANLKGLKGATEQELTKKATSWLKEGINNFSRGKFFSCEQLK